MGVFLFLVACGEVKAKPDGGGGGGGGDDSGVADAATDGPAVGDATVAVTLDGVAQSGVRVNFQATDGSLTSEAMTDSNGVATGEVHTNAMVTVAIGPNDLVTITGVNPGEQVVLKNRKPFDSTAVTTAAFGASSEATNKYFYRADVGEANGESTYVTAVNMTSGTRTLDVSRGSLDAMGRFNLVAAVYDMNNKLIAYSSTNRTPSSTGTTTATVPTPWRTDISELTVSIAGAPTDTTTLSVVSTNEQSGMLYVPSNFPVGSPYPGSAPIANGTATVVVPYLAGFGDYVHTRAIVKFAGSTYYERMDLVRRVARPAPAFTIASGDLPARIGSPALDATVPTRPVITWTLSGSTANGDANSVDLNWKDASAATYRWHVYLPPDATTVTFPEVSASIAAQAPAQTSMLSKPTVAQHCLDPLAGYAAFHLAPPLNYSDSTYYETMPLGFQTWFYSSIQ